MSIVFAAVLLAVRDLARERQGQRRMMAGVSGTVARPLSRSWKNRHRKRRVKLQWSTIRVLLASS